MVEYKDGRMTELEDELIDENTYMTIREFAEAKRVSEALVRQWKHRGIIDGIDSKWGHFIRAETEIRLKKLKKKRTEPGW